MAINKVFETQLGFSVYNNAGFLSGPSAPGGDAGVQDSMVTGSLYLRTTNPPSLYQKITNVGSSSDWVVVPAPDSTNTINLVSDVIATNKNIYARHFYAGPAGGYHIYDINGSPTPVEIFNILPDGQPADNIRFNVGTLTPSMTALTIATATGAFVFYGSVSNNSALILGNIIRLSTSSSANDWSPTGLVVNGRTAANTIIVNATANISMTGLEAAQVDGTQLYIYNTSSTNTLTLAEDFFSSSLAKNRFLNPTIINPKDGALLIYDENQELWIIFYLNQGSDVQIFTTSGANTWTKPPKASVISVCLIGGGGGGGSGRRGDAGTLRRGGGGGGGGGISEKTFPASAIAQTVTVTVGAGGTGGAARTTANTNGLSGGSGNNTSFGNNLVAYGGLGGAGGTNNGVDVTPTYISYGLLSNGCVSQFSSIDGTTIVSVGSPALYGGANGGAGGTIGTGNTPQSGVNGTSSPLLANITPAGGTGGGSSTSSTAAITGGAGSSANITIPGSGGGGGGANSSTGLGGNGGNGTRGSGGGGGGASTSGNSGAGGNGGVGTAIVITYR